MSSTNWNGWGLCFRDVTFPPIHVVGACDYLKHSSGVSRAEHSVIIPQGACMPMALLVAPPTIGVVIALMVAFQLQSWLRLRLPWPDNLLRPLLSL